MDHISDEDVAKFNRRKKEEADRQRMVVSAPPSIGIHQESRKARDRRRNLAVKKVLR